MALCSHRVRECRSHILINLCSSTFQFSQVITLPNDHHSRGIQTNNTLINKCVLWSNLHISGLCIILFLCGGLRALSRSQCVIIWLPVPCYLSVYYTHCPGTARKSFILHRSPLSWYMELLCFYITTLCLQSKHTCILYRLSQVCRGVCLGVVKGKCVCWL